MVICNRDDEIVFNTIFNDVFELNRDWYAKNEHDDTGKFIYWLPPLEDDLIDEQGRCFCRHELQNQRSHWEDAIRDKNQMVLDIIPLNTKDNNDRPTMGASVAKDKSSVDSLLVHTPTE